MATQSTTIDRQQGAFSLDIGSDGIARIRIDVPGESQNILKAEFADQAAAVLDTVEADADIKGVVFISGKPGSFIAGADIKMLTACRNAQEAEDLSRAGQRVFNRIEALKVPAVAAIDGPCLGGGLELALACHGRVASDGAKTVLGLPEVMIGVLPGTGGSQRLPRLIGIAPALELMLTGKHIAPRKALRLKLVDEVVPLPILEQTACELIAKLQQNRQQAPRKRGVMGWALESNPIGRKVLFEQARKQMLAKTHGNYPAPKRIIDVVELGIRLDFEAGLQAEAKHFGELAVSPEARALMGIYFATTAMKKATGVDDPKVRPREVKKLAVLGAGLMGAGISYVSIDKAGLPVRLKDTQPEGIGRGLKYVDKLLQSRIERGSLTPIRARIERSRLTPTLDYSGFTSVDLVIEAVFEDLALKQQMVKDIEAHCGERTVFASNTSSIPIDRIAEAAARPQNVIGMHYFSPVEKMPLLEVIPGRKTSAETIATTVAVGRQQGKTVIVVKDGAGFYVNRILTPYINEACHLLLEGVAIDRIDRTLVEFGFPIGPFALLDEVGLDVGAKVGPILFEAFGERMRPVESIERMLADGRHGKKSKKGFYKYEGGKKGHKKVDDSVYDLLGVKSDNEMSATDIVDRCVLMMVNEAARCHDEGVIRSLRDGDIGAVFGIGFPPFRGGPFRYIDERDVRHVVSRLRDLANKCGARFAPAETLVAMAEENRRYYDDEPT